MTAIEATARTARTLEDGTLRLTIEFEPKDAQEAFNLFCTQGTKLAVVALKDGYYVEQHEFQPEPEAKTLDDVSLKSKLITKGVHKDLWNPAVTFPEPAREPLKIEGVRASRFAAMMTQEPNYWQFIGVLSEHEADIVLKESTGTTSKREFDWDGYAHRQLADHFNRYIQWSKMRGVLPPVSREHGINYLGGSLDEDDGLSLANEA